MGPDTKKLVEGLGDNPLATLLGDNSSRPQRLIPFPGQRGKSKEEGGQGAQVVLWALGSDEITAASVAALQYFTGTLKIGESQLRYLEAELDLERKMQQLIRAMRHPERPLMPFARDITDVRKLEPDEHQALYEQLLDFTVSRSPFRAIKTLEELDEVIVDLGKGSAVAETWLRSFDNASLRSIIREQAARLLSATKGNSLDTSPQNDSSTS